MWGANCRISHVLGMRRTPELPKMVPNCFDLPPNCHPNCREFLANCHPNCQAGRISHALGMHRTPELLKMVPNCFELLPNCHPNCREFLANCHPNCRAGPCCSTNQKHQYSAATCPCRNHSMDRCPFHAPCGSPCSPTRPLVANP